MMDFTLRPIAVIYPRPLRVEYYRVLHTPYDSIQVAVAKLQEDRAAWVKREDVETVKAQLQEVTVGERP